MATYKKLTEIEVMEKPTENSMAIVEENGSLKRVPAGDFGGGVATAIITGSNYTVASSGNSPAPAASAAETFTCSNMTFEEAKNILLDMKPLDVFVMCGGDMFGGCVISRALVSPFLNEDVPCIFLVIIQGDYQLYWTADGILDYNPNQSAD